MPSREDIEKLSRELHEDESSQNDEQLREGIERLRHKNDEIVAVHDAAVRTPLESQLTAATEEIESAKRTLKAACDRDWEDETLHQVASIASNAIYWRDKTITEANAKVKKLREAIEDYIHNDIGRKDTLLKLDQAIADTEEK